MNGQPVIASLAAWLASGESATVEFKKSTAEKERGCRWFRDGRYAPVHRRLARRWRVSLNN